MKFIDDRGNTFDTYIEAFMSNRKQEYMENAWANHCAEVALFSITTIASGFKSIIGKGRNKK